MNIRLLHMKMENFMNYVEKEIDFTNRTFIFGQNGVGKSTIATAYNWCLFNCDYDLKDNPDVRRRVNGVSIGDVDVAVTLVLDVDGKEVTMRKVQKRTYGKDGVSYKDDNKYFVNEVPKTMKDFSTYLEVDMKVLLMCSNINAFLNQKPAEMREFLFSHTDTITDSEVAEKNTELTELVDYLEKYSVEEITLMNKKVVADVKKELPILDGQIKEKERDIQLKSDMDISDLEIQRNALKEQIQKNIEEQSENEKIIKKSQEISDGILELKFAQSEIKRKANENIIAEKTVLNEKISEKKFLIGHVQDSIRMAKQAIKTTQDNIDRYEHTLEGIRKEWVDENAREMDKSKLICPYCKQEYSPEKQNELIENFSKEKAELLKAITENGNRTKALLDVEKEKNEKIYVELNAHNESFFMLDAAKSELEKKLSQVANEVDVVTIPEYQRLQTQIKEKEEILRGMNSISEYRKELKNKEAELREQLAECEKKISSSDTETDEKRLGELQDSKQDMVQKQVDSEKILFLLDLLSMDKNNLLSDAINSKFNIVKWKLWELNKSGAYKNICTPMVDGKSILTTMSNKGNRILGKVDICRGIQEITKISAPIWLDDSESLDEQNQKKVANMVNGQLIMLIVDDSNSMEVKGR